MIYAHGLERESAYPGSRWLRKPLHVDRWRLRRKYAMALDSIDGGTKARPIHGTSLRRQVAFQQEQEEEARPAGNHALSREEFAREHSGAFSLARPGALTAREARLEPLCRFLVQSPSGAYSTGCGGGPSRNSE